MSKNAVKLIDILGEKFGSETVTKQQIASVAEENGIPSPTWIFSNKDLRVSRGLYRIPGTGKSKPTKQKKKVETATASFQPNQVVSSLSVETTGFSENLIPDKDGLFVPFGNFKTVKQVIQSKMFYPVFVTGLSGNGKTFSVEQACAQTKREVIRVNFTVETDEDDLIGGFRLVNGETKFFKGPVIKAMERGAVLLLDEIDLGNPAKIMCLQSILEGKGYFIKKTGEYIKPTSGFTVVATANTKGKGSDDGRFIGTNILNEAFLERFPVTFEQDYPSVAIEIKILESVFDDLGVKDKEFVKKLVDWADIIRKTFYDGGVDEIISTRRLVHIAKAFSIFGDRMTAIEMCTNRFDDDTKQSFMELYSKIDSDVEIDSEVQTETSTTDEIAF